MVLQNNTRKVLKMSCLPLSAKYGIARKYANKTQLFLGITLTILLVTFIDDYGSQVS